MRHEEGAGAGIKEGAREPREGFRTFGAAGSRIAGRKYDPIRIEFQRCDLGGRQQAVIGFRGNVRRGEHECRLCQPGKIARHQRVSGEVHDAIVAERGRLDQ